MFASAPLMFASAPLMGSFLEPVVARVAFLAASAACAGESKFRTKTKKIEQV